MGIVRFERLHAENDCTTCKLYSVRETGMYRKQELYRVQYPTSNTAQLHIDPSMTFLHWTLREPSLLAYIWDMQNMVACWSGGVSILLPQFTAKNIRSFFFYTTRISTVPRFYLS